MQLAQYLRGFTNFVVGVVEAFLGLRFVLRLFGANAENEFVSWVYETSAPLLQPFENIFETVREGGLAIEFSTLFAMLVYAILAYLLFALFDTLGTPVLEKKSTKKDSKKSTKKKK